MQTETELLYSSFGADPDMSELAEMFVDEMPVRIQCLTELVSSEDWQELGRFAHQLKGAAGGYGFDQLTPLAAHLETSVRDGNPEANIRDAADTLIDACSRVRAGAP
jgi:HPt (histidine-containing phosphotransfer) domain-containing protein